MHTPPRRRWFQFSLRSMFWLRNGRLYHLTEPNQAILDYLQTGKSPLDSSPEVIRVH